MRKIGGMEKKKMRYEYGDTKNRKPDIWKDRPENVQKHDTGLFTSIVEAVGGTFRTS